MIVFRFVQSFAADLKDQVEDRFPQCGTKQEAYCFANYLDPAFRGVHLETLNRIKVVKDAMVLRWGDTREEVMEESEGEPEISKLDPTDRLLKARRCSGEEGVGDTKIQREMVAYEALGEFPTNGNRLRWWKEKEEMLPMLAGAAREILGLPCSSAKSERVYSVGSRNVTKSRASLKPKKVEHLIVNVENRQKIEDFVCNSSYKLGEEQNLFDGITSTVVAEEEQEEVGSSVFTEMEPSRLLHLEYSDSSQDSDSD